MTSAIPPEKRVDAPKIVIVGGGSAGWIAASYISKALNFNCDVTVVESPRIGRIGVGEATIPTIKEELFDFLEIPESEWMCACQGTYKLAIRFQNWKKSAADGGDHYYHSFGEMPLCKGVPLSHIWMYKRLAGLSSAMDDSCYVTPSLCEGLRAPKGFDHIPEVHYAYHFDALAVADFLQRWCIARGVRHSSDEITAVETDTSGNITLLRGHSGTSYHAEIFVDCSGFAGLLIEKTLQEPWVSFASSLLTDRAVALNIPSDSAAEGIRPYTTATAMTSGWMWEIPLFSRSGNGYVYSSAFQGPEEAEKEIRSFFGKKAESISARHIQFRSGRRRNAWVNNCVSFGLASCFLEPLESTGLYFIYAALYQFIQHFPGKIIDPILREKYNERVAYMVDDVRDFIVMHFVTSPRQDTSFWKACRSEIVIPESLRQILALQRAGIPFKKSYHENSSLYSSFEAGFDRFWTNSNYQCVLSGVGYLPDGPMPILNLRDDILSASGEVFAGIAQRKERLEKSLPGQYQYLARLYGVG